MEKESSLADRFQALLDHYKIGVKELTEKIGGSRATYFNIKNGSSQPDFKTFNAILTGFPEVSAEWLTRGDGPMLKAQILSQEEAEALRAENRAIKAMYRAELLGKSKGAILCPDMTRVIRKRVTAETMKLPRVRRTSRAVSVRVQEAVIPNIMDQVREILG